MSSEGNASSDERARFEQIALPLASNLYNGALRLCRDPHDASDIVQETYLRAYRTFENFRPGTNCKAWLFKIMYSVFVNKYRKKKREPTSVQFDELFHQRASEWGNTPEAARMRAGRSAAIERALNELPEAFRSAVLLIDVYGLSYDEAADSLDCPVGTVRSRLSRGRKSLFVALSDFARQTDAIGTK